jgi:uncharacterized membrane protein
MKNISVAICLFAAIALGGAVRAAGPYVLTDLGHGYANGINSYGQVVGATSSLHAFLWTPTVPNGTSGSFSDLSPQWVAAAVNGFGQVGACVGPTCSPQQAPSSTLSLLWTPTVANGTTGDYSGFNNTAFGAVQGINATGQVVGSTGTSSFSETAGLWSPTSPNGTAGTFTSLGVPASHTTSQGLGINSFGQVVGNADYLTGDWRAILWTPTTANGTSGSWVNVFDFLSEGRAINDRGQVAGSNLQDLYLWTPTVPNGTTGTATNLGHLPGTEMKPFSISSGGSIVGTTQSSQIAFLWEPSVPNGSSGTLWDLSSFLSPNDAANWQLSEARGINDRGQIVGYGQYDPDGPGGAAATTRMFLLTPVPEPASLMLLIWMAPVLTSLRLQR